MLSRLIPKQIDNTYRGSWIAVWIMLPILLIKLAMGFNVAGLNPWVSNRYVAETADAIPLASFGPEAASTVMFMFASWGLMLLLFSLLGLLVLVRYRAMTPLMLLLLTLEQVGRKVIGTIAPIERAVQTSGLSFAVLINWGFTIALLIALLLSLTVRASAVPVGDVAKQQS